MAASQGPFRQGRDKGAGRELQDLFCREENALGPTEVPLKEHRGGGSGDECGRGPLAAC